MVLITLKNIKRFVKKAVICMLAALMPMAALPLFASASGGTITETLNITRPEKNLRGDGYYWSNRYETLELRGVRIETDDEYGLKLQDGATIELYGDNYISASRFAIGGQGSFTITGEGTLTLAADEAGLMSYSTDAGADIRIRSGRISISGGSGGILCESGSITMTGGAVSVTVSSDEGVGAQARHIQISGGSYKSDSPIAADKTLKIIAADVMAVSRPGGAALSAGERMEIGKVDIEVSDDRGQQVATERYAGEAGFFSASNAYRGGTSAILGEGYPRYADTLLVSGAILLLALVTLLPLALHYRRTQALKRAIEAENSSRQ